MPREAKTRARRDRANAPANAKGALEARLAALGCDPIAIIAGLAMDSANDARLRLAAAKELAGYLMIKPRGGAPSGGLGGIDVAGIIARSWQPAGDGGEGNEP